MRVARVICASDQQERSWEDKLAAADLDFLQLDYRWLCGEEQSKRAYSKGFLKQLPWMHRSLYLEPRLQLVTNAGGGNVRQCVEHTCQCLIEHGSENMLVSSVRGANLLNQLEELSADGVELVDSDSGKSLLEVEQPLLSAQVELGAGPLAMAFADDARIVIAGCYDGAAPFLAAATERLQWPWDNYNGLAKVAVASELSALLQPYGPMLEWDEAGQAKLVSLTRFPVDMEAIKAAFRNKHASMLRSADVISNFADTQLSEDEFGRVAIEGVTGQPASENWNLKATFVDGWYCSAWFEITGSEQSGIAEQITSAIDLLSQENNLETAAAAVETLMTSNAPDSTLVRAICQSKNPEDCEVFLSELSNLAVRVESPDCRPWEFPLRILPRVKEFCIPIPRDAVTLSVDTRPAKDWT